MRRSFFYGYVILALCFCNMVFVRGISSSFSVFYVALLEDFRWSHGVGASIVSVSSLIYALASPLVGWSFDRLGPRVLMPLGGLLVAAGLLFSGSSRSLWELYCYYGVITALGQACLGFVSQSALISHWFVKRRATALGIANMGQGLGTLAIVPLTQILMSRLGWRSAFFSLAVLIFFSTFPANAILQRRSPKEVNQLPDGVALPANQKGYLRHRTSATRAWTLTSALRSFPFWALAAGHLALGTGIFMIYTHVVAHLVHQGLSGLIAAFALGLMGFTRFGGTLFWGWVSDRMGRSKAYGIGTLVVLAGVLCLAAVESGSALWFVYASAIIFGIGHSSGNPTYGAVIGDIFSGSNVGAIFGFLEVGFGLGMAFGAWLGGYIFDLTGSYRPAFLLCLATFAISYLGVRASLVWHAR